MSGVKQYDRTELLDLAVELFRRQGYTGTSTAELVAELGVNRKSMYAEFGSKQGLFEAALERYNQEHLSNVLAPIEAPTAGVEAIREAFASYADASEGWVRGRGCLLCNTAVERAAHSSASWRSSAPKHLPNRYRQRAGSPPAPSKPTAPRRVCSASSDTDSGN